MRWNNMFFLHMQKICEIVAEGGNGLDHEEGGKGAVYRVESRWVMHVGFVQNDPKKVNIVVLGPSAIFLCWKWHCGVITVINHFRTHLSLVEKTWMMKPRC